MTDIHCHLIYDVDDGCRDIKESVLLLKKMKSVGFNNVIITPHYIENSEYDSENAEKLEKLENIKATLKKNNIDINVFLGNEIFISENIVNNVKDGKIYPLNNSKYLLIEFPFHNEILNIEDFLYEIKINGYIPIIAHPERYDAFKHDYSIVKKFKEEGILFQSNYSSILGYYGKHAKKLMKKMLKDGYIEYLGTDLHRKEKTFVIDNFKKIEKKIKRITGKKIYAEIMKNCDNLVE